MNRPTNPLVDALLSKVGRTDPYPIYEQLRATDGEVRTPWGALLFLDYASCSEVLSDLSFQVVGAEVFDRSKPEWRQRPSLVDACASLVLLNRPEHTRLRRLLNRYFTARAVAERREHVASVVRELLDDLDRKTANGGVADFVTTVADVLPMAVVGELLGVPREDHTNIAPLTHDFGLVLDVLPSRENLDRADAAARTLREYLGELIAERRSRPTGDLVSLLVADEGERLSMEELVSNLELLLVAGLETTSGMFSNAIKAFSLFPDQAAWLRDNPEEIGRAVQELLRYDPPAQLVTRIAAKDTMVGGRPVAAGQLVHCMLGAAHRDPAVFEDADRLDFRRESRPPIPFGGGVHHCLGAALARLEAEVFFPEFLARFPELHIAGEPVRRPGLNIRSFAELPVRVDSCGQHCGCVERTTELVSCH